MPVERLRTQDAVLWCVQDRAAPLQIGALCLFEARPLIDDAGALRLEEMRRHLESRLQAFARLRQRLAPVPFDQGRPVWVDDGCFDIANHVRAAALPHPGGEVELRELVARLIEVPLDPARPLWEIWLIEGLEGDRVAVVPKVSHVMADGMAVLEFALAALDAEPRSRADSPEPWTPDAAPTDLRLLIDGIADRTRREVGALAGAAATLTRPRHLIDRVGALAGAGVSTLRTAPGASFTRSVGPHRDFAWLGLPMADLVEVKHSQGVTLNDVGLTIVAGALCTYLGRTSGDTMADAPGRARVLVPVSTHTGTAGETENRFSMMVADLPIATEDPVVRLREVHAEMVRRKQSAQQAIGPMLFGLGDIVPEGLLRFLGPPILRRQPFVNLAVTNLPGTDHELFLLGSRMLELYPFISVTGNIGVIIGMLSYGGHLGVGITVDADVVPDVDDLAAGIGRASQELVEAVRRR